MRQPPPRRASNCCCTRRPTVRGDGFAALRSIVFHSVCFLPHTSAASYGVFFS
ncbi:hypothetical protein TSAR_015146 [Trichomalopsis sarcophagae]|uniref:Uncharacterized protein n=1 Tax=Trichomalopsis sarcophagae TaxID=543379 RepID=A0A232EY59_9HYME|nr:hypothetical protein TSAR_015146 [Trichomalopsis sarcophagae]